MLRIIPIKKFLFINMTNLSYTAKFYKQHLLESSDNSNKYNYLLGSFQQIPTIQLISFLTINILLWALLWTPLYLYVDFNVLFPVSSRFLNDTSRQFLLSYLLQNHYYIPRYYESRRSVLFHLFVGLKYKFFVTGLYINHFF